MPDCSSDQVNAHIRNLSLASIIQSGRPGARQILGEQNENEGGKRDEGDGLIKQRSPLADMLYMRCECLMDCLIEYWVMLRCELRAGRLQSQMANPILNLISSRSFA